MDTLFPNVKTKRQLNALSLCRDPPPNTRFNICVSHPPDSCYRILRLDFVKLMCYHRMFQHGVDFYRTFTVGLSHWGGTPSNSMRLTKSSAKITKNYIIGRKYQKVCQNKSFYVLYARMMLQNCIFGSYLYKIDSFCSFTNRHINVFSCEIDLWIYGTTFCNIPDGTNATSRWNLKF